MHASQAAEQSAGGVTIHSLDGCPATLALLLAAGVQVLQTLSILIQNLRNQQTVYYLFSNNHINEIVSMRFDFEDDEVLVGGLVWWCVCGGAGGLRRAAPVPAAGW